MTLRQVTDAQEWDGFVAALPHAQFTQSWAWGEFRKSRGQEVVRLMGEGAAAMFFKVPAPVVGGYWYAPRGPVASNVTAAQQFLGALVANSQALPGRSLFWRVEPSFTECRMPKEFRRSHTYMPACTLLVDVAQSEEALQAAMHEKTRYNIRVAERRGVTVRTATDTAAIETFLRLNEETATRDEFRSQPSVYIRATCEALFSHGMARIRIAEQEGAPLAASVEICYGDTVTYLYGASASAGRNAMAPYALHWSALQAAAQGGYRWYDFHGMNPTDLKSPFFKASWAGITRFKRGWGGEEVGYVGTWELPKSPIWYTLFRLARPA